ncbi:Tfb4-domain-containing protein [Pluteus cervinus]|uniref:Tfb4-domain-containing protein n=1 Tax=Pluteus cervinus TaxID=181527 RepID=A0ACD3B896_9AGAR|nr:Tfb4-domain-containing protein [Pluteus cervinus]
MADSRGSHLSVVLDLSPSQWHLSAENPPTNPFPLSLSSFLSQLLTFLNAHIASKHENSLAVFGAFPRKSILLYASSNTPTSDDTMDANWFPPFRQVDFTVVRRITEELDSLEGASEDEAPTALVGALTKALCYVNRIMQPPAQAIAKPSDKVDLSTLPEPHILILSVSPDLATSYIPIMNAIFSAQKLKVMIDVCQIYGEDSVFLQQAAHLTGGSYILLERRDALLQYLIMCFLSPQSIRQTLSVPTQDRIDFRAACFCHKNIVDIGFICSVCLSIFCQPVPVCSTCRTKFPMKTLQRLNASRPASANVSNRPSPSPAQSRPAVTSTNGDTPRSHGLSELPSTSSINAHTRTASNGTKSS